MKPEKQLEEIFRKSVSTTYGARAFFRKTHGDMFTGAGTPDFVGHIYGACVELELKVHPGVFSQLQKNNIRDVAASGGFSGGILQYESSYYFLSPMHVYDFSYRSRPSWVPLPLYRMTTRNGLENRLNLAPLTMLVTMHITAMQARKHVNDPIEE